MKRCTKGKSCGATCITKSDRCVLELGPVVSESLTKVRSKLGVVKMYYKVRDQGVKGGQARFERIRKEFANEIGGRIDKTKDLIELKKRVQEEGLLPKTKKSEDLGDIFKGLIEQGRKERAPSVPQDLKAQLAALGGAPRQLERSPGAKTKTPPAALKKGNTENMLDDISKILRGESPSFIQMASAPGFEGFKARFLESPTQTGGSATGNTRWARSDAKDFDMDLGKVRREGSKSYNGWEDSYASGARKIGEGAYGTVMRNPDGTFVKRGAISDTEALIMKRLGDIDLGPKLKAADINGEHPYQKENFVDIRNGRIAMGEVPGKPLGSAKADTKFGGKNAADVYWKAMADLHRQGIAHNDAHIDNILVDKNGKGRWVDLGMAQLSPKAALAEALGIFPTLKGGDDVTTSGGAKGEGNWQTKRWDGTGVKELQRARDKGGQTWTEMMQRFPVASRVWENKPDVVYELKRMGLDVNEINSMIYHGIRSPLDSYDKADGFGRITDQQAQKLLDILYDGI